MNFNDILRAQRQSQHLTIEDAAENVSLSTRAYQDLEDDRAEPNVPERLGLLLALGMPYDEAMDAAKAPDRYTFDSDLMKRTFTQDAEDRFVRETDDEFIIVNRHHEFHEYNIPKQEVQTAEHILNWVSHLSEKPWVSRRQIGEFVQVASSHLGLAIHG